MQITTSGWKLVLKHIYTNHTWYNLLKKCGIKRRTVVTWFSSQLYYCWVFPVCTLLCHGSQWGCTLSCKASWIPWRLSLEHLNPKKNTNRQHTQDFRNTVVMSPPFPLRESHILCFKTVTGQSYNLYNLLLTIRRFKDFSPTPGIQFWWWKYLLTPFIRPKSSQI